ncbi:MAG: hypothetical protein M3083_20330 [Actinomycetota bacterium]|nr:hypothetical protein [Actinomycetota bacterium]MDQ6945019.1 hypothetical protein [Actinomycetota bacterium]
MLVVRECLAERLSFLKHGLGVILGIGGLRLTLDGFYPVPTWVELLSGLIVIAVAVVACVTSLYRFEAMAPRRPS